MVLPSPDSSSVHPTPKARKPLKVVVKKTAKHRGTAKRNLTIRQRQVPDSRKRGLPSFSHNHKVDEVIAQKTTLKSDDDNNDLDPLQQNDDDDFFVNLECDTLLAIRTLHQHRYNDPNPMPSCLEIPVDDGTLIQGVLECQLHEFFTSGSGTKGGSSLVVSQELDQLLRNSTLQRLSNTITTNTAVPITVYIFTKDYQRAARAAVAAVAVNTLAKNKEESQHSRQHGQVILDWFLQNLHQWTGHRISHTALLETWHQNPPLKTHSSLDHSIHFEAAIRWLQEQQLLHTAAMDHTDYQLWLPTWGRHVVPAILQAKTEALAFLQQSRSKERSVSSVVQRLHRHPIPVNAFLIPWWVEQGWVRRVTRPAGPALQFVAK